MSRKQLNWLVVVIAVVLVVAVFLIVSLCLSQHHGITLVQEWQTWFGVKQTNANPVSVLSDCCLFFRI